MKRAPATAICLLLLAGVAPPRGRLAAQTTDREWHRSAATAPCIPGGNRIADRPTARLPSAADGAGTTVIAVHDTPPSDGAAFDVVLDLPNVSIDYLMLRVDSLVARLSLDFRVANLVRVSAGAEATIGSLELTIKCLRARALLLADLGDLVHIVDHTLTFLDNHPEIVSQLRAVRRR